MHTAAARDTCAVLGRRAGISRSGETSAGPSILRRSHVNIAASNEPGRSIAGARSHVGRMDLSSQQLAGPAQPAIGVEFGPRTAELTVISGKPGNGLW